MTCCKVSTLMALSSVAHLHVGLATTVDHDTSVTLRPAYCYAQSRLIRDGEFDIPSAYLFIYHTGQ